MTDLRMKDSPMQRQMIQVAKARNPKNPIEELVVENSQSIGMKPSSSRAVIQIEQIKTPRTTRNLVSTLHSEVKMNKLGRQMSEANKMPPATFTGAAHSWSPAENMPRIKPNRA